MKKLFAFLIIAALIMSMLGMTAYAEENADTEETETTEPSDQTTPSEDTTPSEEDPGESEGTAPPEDETPSENPILPGTPDNTEDTVPDGDTESNFITRIIESFTQGQASDIVTMAFSVFVVILMTVLKNATKTSLSDLTSMFSKSDESSKLRVNKLIDIVNGIVTDMKTFFKQSDEGQTNTRTFVESQMTELKENLNTRLKELEGRINVQTVTQDQMKDLAEGVKALNEMFLIVYQGSKTIPAATKEIIAEKCSQGLKALNSAQSEVNTNDGKG